MSQLAHALAYLDAGFSIFPLNGKRPAVSTWYEFMKAPPTKDRVERFYDANPTSNIAIVTGEISGVSVLDLDAKGDQKMIDEFLKEFPTPLVVKTGGGGIHAYYKYAHVKNAVRVRYRDYALDVRSDRGYVVAPPSVHPDTRLPYVFAHADLDPAMLGDIVGFLPAFPEPIATTLAQQYRPTKLPEDWRSIINGSAEGTRNHNAASLIGKLLPAFAPQDWHPVVWPLVKAWNTVNVKPPLPEQELYNVYTSIAKSDLARREKEEQAYASIANRSKAAEATPGA